MVSNRIQMEFKEMKIEKGVPIPEQGENRKMKYPWRQMEVGDSFFIECDVYKANSVLSAARSWSYRNTDGLSQFARREEDNGYRFWRIK